MNYGINGSINASAARRIIVESSTVIAIIGTSNIGLLHDGSNTHNGLLKHGESDLYFFGNASLALETFKGTIGIIEKALIAIDAQEVTCPIIINALPDTAVEADIIAAVTKLSTAYAVTGYRPDLIVCPEWSGTATVGAAMDAVATKLWATAIIDVTAMTESAALAYAGNFGTRFALLVGPDSITVNGAVTTPCASIAGLIAAMDASNPFGWAESASNRVVKGVSSTERIVDYADGQDCEARRLRNAGIASIVRDVGWRLYGFETTDIDPIWQSLERVRTFYRMLRAMQTATKWARDRQADELLMVKKSVEEFMRELIGNGVGLGFEVFFDSTKNTKATVTAGKFYLTVRFQNMPIIRELNIELVYTDDYSDVLLTIING